MRGNGLALFRYRRPPLGVKHQPGAAVGKDRGKRSVGQDDWRGRIGDDEAYSFGRIGGIKRQVGSAGFVNGKDRDDKVGVRGSAMPTTTPGPTPRAASRRAKRAACSWSEAKLNCCSSYVSAIASGVRSACAAQSVASVAPCGNTTV